MENKISNEEKLTAQIASVYPMCRISTGSQLWAMCVGVNIKEDMLLLEVDFYNTGVMSVAAIDASKCKLILSPLSKITDEHAIEVAKIVNFEDDIETEDIHLMLVDIFSINNGIQYDYVSGATFIKLINKLREWGYDCDNLINRVLAIEKP